MGQIYVGTAGWSYPQGKGKWDGLFYPRGMADREKLPYYAKFFDTVEVNSTFYRPVGSKVAQSWVDRTPTDFRFATKLYQKFTHPKMFQEATGKAAAIDEPDFDQFKSGIEPIAESGKLGALLAQFPPSFKCTDPNLEYLEALMRQLRAYPLAIELRHRSWTDSPETNALLVEYDVAWTMIDEPKFRTSIGEVPLTSRLGYFRFHGRNFANWWQGDRETRYDYLYSERQQSHLADDVRQVAEKAEDTYAVYNNHFRAQAVVNAIQLKLELGQVVTADLTEEMRQAYPDLAELMSSTARQR